MSRVIIFLIIGLKTVSGQTFTGQVYQLAESFLEEKCSVNPECDCCSNDLIFLSDKEFALITRCIYNDSYFTGTYVSTADKLILTFKPSVVNEIVDEETKEINNQKKKSEIKPSTFRVSDCGQNRLRLEYDHMDGKDFKNGTRHSPTKEKEIIERLKRTPAWKMLTN